MKIINMVENGMVSDDLVAANICPEKKELYLRFFNEEAASKFEAQLTDIAHSLKLSESTIIINLK